MPVLTSLVGLPPPIRDAFRRAAENALATSPICLGPGSIHRTITSIWRTFFRPPREDRGTTWISGQKNPSKLITEPPKDGQRASPPCHRVNAGTSDKKE
jgi:hypothetical protein